MIDCFSFRSSIIPFSGSSQRGGVAVQISNSPEHVAQLELPDLGAEDTLELQLQQLTLAQFTVTTLQHAIPLLKTGGELSVFFPSVPIFASFS